MAVRYWFVGHSSNPGAREPWQVREQLEDQTFRVIDRFATEAEAWAAIPPEREERAAALARCHELIREIREVYARGVRDPQRQLSELESLSTYYGLEDEPTEEVA